MGANEGSSCIGSHILHSTTSWWFFVWLSLLNWLACEQPAIERMAVHGVVLDALAMHRLVAGKSCM